MSRVELQNEDPPVPRFNMPFEAGLAVMYSLAGRSSRHTYFIFEADFRRVQRSLSDLGGSDIYTHGGTQEGVLSQIGNALLRSTYRPKLTEMKEVLDEVTDLLPGIMEDAGSKTLYTPRVFTELIFSTSAVVSRELGRPKEVRAPSGV